MEMRPEFAKAARDYRLLLDRGYPVNACLKLVGDRYRLDTIERMTLFRGILPSEQSAKVKARILADPAGANQVGEAARVALDGYNIFFTITNYLRGHSLFVSTDGLLRDSGGAHGRVADEGQFLRAISLTTGELAEKVRASVTIYLDAPIPFSSRHAEACREKLSAARIDNEVILVPSADPFVAAFEGRWAASADSVVALRAKSPIFDLARSVLEKGCKAGFPDLAALLDLPTDGITP
ncbi:MAG: DUF434 domain-containing protein [Spirochaetes bacterium]|nr:DUF434 domain-containing protein [Spirochaetota bacterium]